MFECTVETSDECKEPIFGLDVFNYITYIIYKSPILQELYLKWCKLAIKEQNLLNYVSSHAIEKDQLALFNPIIQGFKYWDELQDVEGACGFHDNPFELKFEVDNEKKICQLIMTVNQLINNLLLRPMLCEEIRNYDKNCQLKGNMEGGKGDTILNNK